MFQFVKRWFELAINMYSQYKLLSSYIQVIVNTNFKEFNKYINKYHNDPIHPPGAYLLETILRVGAYSKGASSRGGFTYLSHDTVH